MNGVSLDFHAGGAEAKTETAPEEPAAKP
jgi:hypothetical protein